MGQKGFLDSHYCIGVSLNPLSPLAYGTEVLETLLAFAKRRQPAFLLPCIMAGVTGPMSLWGTIVQQNAEILAGATLTYLINPETPIVYCPASTTADMRYASVAYAAPEQFLINTPGLQLAIDRYRLPTRILAGMTASKTEDIQAGAETMMSMLIGLLSGGHIILQSFGVLDFIMTTSYEKFVIDEEIFSGVIRFCRGVNTSDSDAAVKAIQDVGPITKNMVSVFIRYVACSTFLSVSLSEHFLNRTLIRMAIAKWLDGAIINPLDKKMMADIIAATTLAGKDDFYMKYLITFRENKLDV